MRSGSTPPVPRRFRLTAIALAVALPVVVVAGATGLVADGLAVVLGVLVAFIVIGVTVWLAPQWEAARWQRKGIEDEAKLAELTVAARTNLTQAIGGLALVATLAVTAYQVNETRRGSQKTLRLSEQTMRLTEQGQITERFARAVEQLDATDRAGGPAIDVRIGALFSLRRIGLDSERDAQPALLLAAAYMRNNIRRGDGEAWQSPSDSCAPDRDKSRVVATGDLQATLSDVLPALSNKLASLPGSSSRGLNLNSVDFTGVILDKADFAHATLTEASFRNANLASSSFRRPSLADADLRRADLRGACLAGSRLAGANLTDADARNADLSGADLSGADLSGAKLSGANLFKADLGGANLGAADLSNADLREADLLDANLVFADLRATQLEGAFVRQSALQQATTDERTKPQESAGS